MASLGGLLFFFLAFFPQGLFGGKYLLAGDSFFYSYPLRTVAWRMIRQGELPLWTPNILSGYPLLSMAQLGLGYPLTWGYSFLPGYVAEQIYVLAPFLLAPVFTYAYLRQIDRSPLAALLGALTFGYGGMMASPLANNGLMPNAVMWLPLALIAVERARYRPLVRCLLGATVAYTMSVLTGYGQGFLYVSLLMTAYAVCLVLIAARDQRRSLRAAFKSFDPWRPLFVAGASILIAMGVVAFQIFETAPVLVRSVRNVLNYVVFTQGAFSPKELWWSIFEPLFYVNDMSAYVPPLALVLAGWAVYVYWRARGKQTEPRVFFWLIIAIVAVVLMLGNHTPIYRLVYYTPLLNRFRVPSRHTFEWTFAVGVLAAFGWDAFAERFRLQRATRLLSNARTLYAAVGLMLAAVLAGAGWWRQIQAYGTLDPTSGPAYLYLGWKMIFVLLTTCALWRVSLIVSMRRRRTLGVITVLILCFIEPSGMVYRWWGHAGLPAARFKMEGQATSYVKQFPINENRLYTRVALTEQFESPPRFDCANVSAVTGLQNVAGYEPLILDRYSRALGGVGPDSVLRFSAPTPDDSLLSARSHVLDILNTSFVVSYSNLAFIPEPRIADGNIFADLRLPGEVKPQTKATLTVPPTDSDALMLVTSLANSVLTPQGTVVARIRVHTTKEIFEREIRAGIDTAEWAHDRPDVRAIIKHELAPVFDANQVEGPPSFPAYRYKTLLKFDEPQRVTEIEILNVTQAAPLAVYLGRLTNSKSNTEAALGFRPADNWQPVYEQNQTLVMKNGRAAPRAWLVAEAEAVAPDESLRRIRGESTTEFDPRRTALLEVGANELPQLPGGVMAANSSARISVYESNRLQIETSAPTPTMLILSEIFYPGWEATVDGQPARIYVADYLLRSISLPAGQHVIEMRYRAPAARKGAIISGLTLVLIGGLAIYGRRSGTRPHTNG